jgi:hypothetical protein
VGTLVGPDESGPRGEKASTIAFSMELPTSRIELLVSIAASAGIASAFVVASANSIVPKKAKSDRSVVMGAFSGAGGKTEELLY